MYNFHSQPYVYSAVRHNHYGSPHYGVVSQQQQYYGGTAMNVAKVTLTLAGPLAAAVAYKRSKSIPKAVGAFIFSLPYLMYVAIDRD